MTVKPKIAFGTLLKRGNGSGVAPVRAYLQNGSGNAGILYTARKGGTGGNSITVTITVGVSTASTTVAVSTNDITIDMRTDGSSVVLDDANKVLEVVRASADASNLIHVELPAGSNGTGNPAALSQTNLANGAAATETYNTIEGTRNHQGPALDRDFVDATHHSSPQGYRQVQPSFKNPGQFTCDLLYDSLETEHRGLLADYESGVKRNFQEWLTDTGAEKIFFSAYVRGIGAAKPIDDLLIRPITLEVEGAVFPID